MNQCHFIGNFVKDPEVKHLESGTAVVNFVLAINRKIKKGDALQKETAFIECEAWDTGAETIGKNFKKGDPILIHCSVRTEHWETEDGKRSRTKFRVNSFEFLPLRRSDKTGS